MAEERSIMEESLLGKEIVSKTQSHEEQRKEKVVSKDIYMKEMKRICYLAGPMVAIGLSQYLLQVASIIIVGHLGELQLSSTALSISFTTVTGFSFLTGLNNVGGAIAMSISIWLNMIFLGLYMRYSSSCAKTRAPISMELFQGIWEFLRFAIPSAVMLCLEWWSFELMVLLSGLLPNPQLETSVLSVCLNTIATLFMIPYGISAAASTRVSNELGAGNPFEARVAVLGAMSLALIEASIVSGTLFACRHVYGYIFSNDKEVIDYVTVMAPLVSISVILDSIQGVLTGIARGCGWQHLGVYVNLGAFYLCGIPVAAALAFWVQVGGKGLWIGIQVGAFVQCVLLSIITSCINWEQLAIKARQRLFDVEFSAENRLV
ncbi:protein DETOXIFICATION 10-like isoform X4 [Vicia villosa]|uniref:protein DETOXIFICATION 10-like isoform X4 n=1 Tax=Vicia villosa TaxID=3911 RepID=UPI00273BECED|nr:protein DETOXIFICATION 10-like isoform X4 [Vicia villosa]